MDSAKPTKKTKKKKPKKTAFTCNLCSKTFSDKGGLTKHKRIHSTETPYACTLCAYAAKTLQYLKRHLAVKHGQKDKEFECEVCGKRFLYGCQLKEHMRVHTGEKPNKCDVCGKAFNALYSLNTHKLIHTDSKPFKCAFCEYACRDSSTLRKHQARHMGTEKYYQCKMCDVGTKNRTHLKLHIAEKHLNIDVRTHICDTCGKGFKLKANLAIHIKTVHERSRSVKCEVCNATISNRGNLGAHMRTHVDLRPYVCTVDMCERRFKDTSSLRKHKITHFPSKWFPCKICDRRFPHRRRLVKHLATHQAKVKRVECDYCGVRFYNKNYLTRHIQRKHTNKRQKFECDMCDFDTTNKPSIVMHIKYGHAVKNPLECKMCEKKFKRDYNLKLHYWRAHGIRYKITYKKKPKKPVIIVKTEPEQCIEDNEYLQVVKIEPLDEDDMMLQDLAITSNSQLQEVSKNVFKELIDSREKRPDEDKPPVRTFIDKPIDDRVKKEVTDLLERTRRKIDEMAIERERWKYNRLMKRAIVRKARDEARKKIISFNKNIHIQQNSDTSLQLQEEIVNTDSLLVEHFSISHETIEDKEKPVDNPNIVNKNIKNKFVEKCTEVINKNGEGNGKRIPDDGQEKYSEKDVDNINLDDMVENISNIDKVIEDLNKVVTEEDISHNSGNNYEEEYLEKEKEINNGKGESTEDLNANDTAVVDTNKTSNEVPLVNNGKLKLNTHQCYVCFKLFETKDKLLEHCKDHFDVCNIKTLKKCPLCEYATDLSVTKHLKRVHNIKIKIPYGSFKDGKKKDKLRYYYDVKDTVIKKIEIIPSIRNLNNQAYRKIDKKNRDAKNKNIMKTKLVKKGKEWIVVKEKMKINDYMMAKFDKIGNLNVQGDHVDKMKALSRIAKKNGAKILFPCDKCSKICQTLAALKLHGRKHEKNPKPFRPKVWKHKIKQNNDPKNTNPEGTIAKSNTSKGVHNVPTKYVKRDRRKRQDGITNDEYRKAKPEPVNSKHRCEKELIEFYESNIKGGDIEFWQFLKIYNKLGRDNVNDFTDLEKTTEFGVHSKVPEEKKEDNKLRSKIVRRDAFKRVVMLSKKEVMRRNEIREKLREKIRQNNA